jgi:hypothetical protein
MPSLHMPLQSGSDRMLKAMRRSYRRDRYLAILDRVRQAMPEAAITTDIIVGFPGETEADFAETAPGRGAGTLRGRVHVPVLQAAGDARGRTRRPGPKPVVQERYERLVDVVNDITWAENRRLVGRQVELLVAQGEGRKDAATARSSGRGPDNRLVHFTPGRRSRSAAGRLRHGRDHLRRASSPRVGCSGAECAEQARRHRHRADRPEPGGAAGPAPGRPTRCVSAMTHLDEALRESIVRVLRRSSRPDPRLVDA